ncbi:PDE6D, partial [Symbiodinium microadriaticum]
MMNMRDADTGQILWTSRNWDEQRMFDQEMQARIPKEILTLSAVSREINFSSMEQIEDF